MPPACARHDGKVVVRRRTGALARGSLCDLKPQSQSEACTLKHSALNTHTGEHAQNLDEVADACQHTARALEQGKRCLSRATDGFTADSTDY
jgi:hypothetical protein